VLQSANPAGVSRIVATPMETVVEQLATALRERGWCVERDVGQSTFRIPLAIRKTDTDAHALGVLVDDTAHYAQKDLLERYLLRPGVLQAFGWRVTLVFTKDWYHDPAAVMRQIEQAME
jgi:hypothetical protein